MLPSGAVTLLVALLFLTPGFVWEVARGRRCRDGFLRELSTLLLVSVAGVGAALAFLGFVRVVFPSAVVDLGAWVRTGDFYWHRHYGVVLRSVVMVTVLASLVAVALVALVPRRRMGDDESALSSLLARRAGDAEPQPGTQSVVLARARDGRMFQGTFLSLDDVDAAHPVLTMSGPITYRRNGSTGQSVSRSWGNLALPVADLAEVWVRAPAPADADAAGAPDAPAATEPED